MARPKKVKVDESKVTPTEPKVVVDEPKVVVDEPKVVASEPPVELHPNPVIPVHPAFVPPKAPLPKDRGPVILKDVKGNVVDEKNYFYTSKGANSAPGYFNSVCGMPVDREDMLEVFNKIFKPELGFLFYKTKDKEVYVIIVPIKYSSIVGKEHNSIEGDFQKHAISFITEGSVNLDTLRMKLLKVKNTIKIPD